jgi:hypothetical protein
MALNLANNLTVPSRQTISIRQNTHADFKLLFTKIHEAYITTNPEPFSATTDVNIHRPPPLLSIGD